MKPTSSAHEHQGHDRAPAPRPDLGAAATHAHPAPTGSPAPVEDGAHERHAGHSVEMFRDRFWITLLLAIPTLVWSEMMQTSRSRAQALADRAALFLTLVAIVAGAVTLVVWISLGATGAFAVERVVAVLVIACPHALGLAVPLVIAISTTLV